MVLQGLSGVPMVASSPQRHDGGPLNVAVGGPIDVQAYQPPWKSLVEFAQTQDPDRIDPSSHSQYQQLMSHVSTGRDSRLGALEGWKYFHMEQAMHEITYYNE